MKKKILLLFLLLELSPALLFAQQIPLITQERLHQEINTLFKQSQAGQADDLKLLLQQNLIQHAAPSVSLSQQYVAENNTSHTFSSQTVSPVPANTNHPWQVAIFLAVDDDNRLSEGLGVLMHQVTRGILRHGILLDIAPRGTSSKRKTAQLYFIHRQQGKTVTQQRTLSTDVPLEELLAALFKNLKAEENSLYTGVIFSAHGNGFGMGYNDKFDIEVNDILYSAYEQNLHINVLELDSCHMSSLYTAYYASQYKNIDFLSGSSDFEYSTPSNTRLFPFLSFLNYEPKKAVQLAVQSRLRQFNFLEGGYGTTSYSAVHIPSLQHALINWYEAYAFLQKSADEPLSTLLTNLLKKDENWRSLSFIIRKQKEYVISHYEELNSDYNNFDTIKREFIEASDTLLQALSDATLIQWCYSASTNRIYQGPSAGKVDCLQSISASLAQFKWLWEEQSDQLQTAWEQKTRTRRFR